MSERVVIIGAGVAGLATALTLNRLGLEVIVVERDEEPPDISSEDAFTKWSRPGVPQFRHAHLFLGRLHSILRDRYPDLHAALLAAGLELSTLEEVLPASHAGIKLIPGDEDLVHYWGRRATFEYVLRRYVGELPGVLFIHSAKVHGLVTESDARGVRVRGVELTQNGTSHKIDASFVVDASGKRSKSPEWLRALGVRVDVDSNPSDFVYACRHYRLKDPQNQPPRRDGGGNFDYLGYATFYAEHGHFAVTFGCPVEERELAAAIPRTESFEALIDGLPVLKHWTGQSEVLTKVLGAGRFENRWTHFRTRGKKELLGFFPVGDSHVETNPMYGRGCAAAFWQAETLAEVLAASDDERTRAREFPARVKTHLKAPFDLSVATDRMYHMRARLARGLPVPLPARLLNYAYETAWLPAVHSSPLVAREMIKAMQMRDVSPLGERLSVIAEILRTGFRTALSRKRVPLLPPPPARTALLDSLPPPPREQAVTVQGLSRQPCSS
jgi:2-polyprenyl-6-methoxyphenol hydroxylase-like FAD-dependent oxidoreductase